MVLEPTSVGLDVHARSVVAGCWMRPRGSCGRGGCRQPLRRWWPGSGRCPARWRWPMRLARLLAIGELPGVRVPTVTEEAARDLVRAREGTPALT
jgi:hypothetical protein